MVLCNVKKYLDECNEYLQTNQVSLPLGFVPITKIPLRNFESTFHKSLVMCIFEIWKCITFHYVFIAKMTLPKPKLDSKSQSVCTID